MNSQIERIITEKQFAPIYEQIAEHLRESIINGNIPFGEKLPPEPSLAKKLGTSRETLRKALRIIEHQGLISQRRGKGTFVVYGQEKEVTEKRIGITAIPADASHSGEDSYFSQLTQGINESVKEHNLELNYIPFTENIMDGYHHHRLDGILIINPVKKLAGELANTFMSSVPHVFVSVKYDFIWNGDFNCIDTDNVGGAELIVNYLLELGHKKIAFIGRNPEISNSIDRLAGYQRTLKKNGVRRCPEYIVKVRSGFDFEDSYQGTLELCDGQKHPTAIITAGLNCALSSMKAIHDRGLMIPNDISLVSFDDFQICNYLTPPLTTVRQPIFELGRRAVDLLALQIFNNRTNCRKELLKTELVVRESCKRLES